MTTLLKIAKYTFYDTLRSSWALLYCLFFLLSSFSLLYLSDNLSQGIISLMNIVLAIIPLISIIFGTMYFYNSRDFAELILSQPINRRKKFLGQYIGLSGSLSISFLAGVGIPLSFYGMFISADIWNYLVLLLTGLMLTFIFVGIAFLVSIKNEDRIKGFGMNILIWLLMAVIYDGAMVVAMLLFSEYPLEQAAIVMSVLNPIDLSRILIMLKLDVSALMGYTGAVFNKFFGTSTGMYISFSAMALWILIPLASLMKVCSKKDF
jgi:Cu-processing system permease protein